MKHRMLIHNVIGGRTARTKKLDRELGILRKKPIQKDSVPKILYIISFLLILAIILLNILQ